MSLTVQVISRRMLTAKFLGSVPGHYGRGGTTNIIANNSGLPLPVIIPSLFHTASSIIRSVDSGPNKGQKVYVTLKNNYTLTYSAGLILRDLIAVSKKPQSFWIFDQQHRSMKCSIISNHICQCNLFSTIFQQS